MRETVGVEDLSWRDMIKDLQVGKLTITSTALITGTVKYNLVKELIGETYTRMYHLKGLTKEDRAEIRDIFNTRQLIPAGNRWLSIEDCVWSSTTNGQEKFVLNMYWPRRKTFLVNFLGVSQVEDKKVLRTRPEKLIPPLNSGASSVEDLDAPRESKYLQILNQVISAAREARFLRQDSIDTSTMEAAIGDVDGTGDDDDDTKLRSDLGAEYKQKIGAAGELYVYELLSTKIKLPLLCREDWKSNIKKYVTEHPKYANMEPWSGSETADLVYFDVESALTALLINGGFLDKKRWTSKKPTYYIEVKTTPGGCGAPFFMSDPQYQRMQATTNGPEGTFPHHRIYIIFRVYNLGKKSIGHTIYVDPESLRAKGALKFTGGNWAVVPGRLA
ncbi:hypothetical protein F4679DRAFT_547579 [Xylaria curta]|nr:hypothetical protein F4679DRAFT_547579 [Xylaria curta]